MAVVVSPQAARGQGGGVLLGNTSPGGLMPIGIVTLEDVIEEVNSFKAITLSFRDSKQVYGEWHMWLLCCILFYKDS